MNPWKTADPERAIEVVHALNAVPWPKSKPETKQFLAELGWHPDPEFNMPVSDLGISPAHVFVTAPGSKEVSRVMFSVADTFPDDDAEAKADFVQDVFAMYAARFRQEWGKPANTKTKRRPEIWWNLPNNCGLKLMRDTLSPDVEFTTPLGCELDKVPDVP